jgi:hypothetical protein
LHSDKCKKKKENGIILSPDTGNWTFTEGALTLNQLLFMNRKTMTRNNLKPAGWAVSIFSSAPRSIPGA